MCTLRGAQRTEPRNHTGQVRATERGRGRFEEGRLCGGSNCICAVCGVLCAFDAVSPAAFVLEVCSFTVLVGHSASTTVLFGCCRYLSCFSSQVPGAAEVGGGVMRSQQCWWGCICPPLTTETLNQPQLAA